MQSRGIYYGQLNKNVSAPFGKCTETNAIIVDRVRKRVDHAPLEKCLFKRCMLYVWHHMVCMFALVGLTDNNYHSLLKRESQCPQQDIATSEQLVRSTHLLAYDGRNATSCSGPSAYACRVMAIEQTTAQNAFCVSDIMLN